MYLIAFDTATTDPIIAHEAITSLYDCEWWHYMGGVYVITGKDSLPHVRQTLLGKWPGGPLLITALRKTSDGYTPDGLLPREAWTWINERI